MITKFIDYMRKNRNLTEKTCTEYTNELRLFAHWGKPRGLRWSTITQRDVEAYSAHCHDEGAKPNTIKKRITAIRMLYKWLQHEGRINVNPALHVESPKNVRQLPKTADCTKIENYLDRQAETDNMAECQLFTAIAYESGMRIGEILSLTGSQINLSDMSCTVKGKGRKERKVFFGRRSASLLARLRNGENGAIFAHGERYYRWLLENQLGGEINGIHPHMLRHTWATNLVNAGMDLQSVALLMGHASVKTTEIYTHIATERLEERFRTYVH